MQNLNININKDDSSINEYLYCLSAFDSFPNKVTIYNTYDFNSFLTLLSPSKLETVSIEIIPNGDVSVINQKQFHKINDGVYLSFVVYDIESELSIASDIIFYYKNDFNNDVNKIIEKISKSIIDYQNDDTQQKFNILTSTIDGLQIEPIDIKYKYDDIEFYYNDDVLKNAKKMVKSIKSTEKGLNVIYGERGVGKTHLLAYITSLINKICIFIPSNMIDTINTVEFKNIIKRHKNSVIIIDDCEIFFSNTYTKSNLFTNNLLQMVDGISSDIDNTHIITILNTNHIKNIDPILLECNNLNQIIEVNRLNNDTVDSLCKHISKKNKFKKPRLIDVLKNNEEKTKGIGF
jgi:DNA replication protein DnaC